ncbi:hypothetical protein PRK78_001441 [Emydomyces testavorans]|uniref:AT hook domain-containing protein n=1 Tax=Emydomyces testavorans TaxID=2070801 RepID=A0AAF0IGV2_9EURO|nr:hypothetical protein PRK78_001441 [Emydomyces testavorans]
MTDADQPLKRKRGRPPKDGGPAKPKPIVLDHSGQPRKRGRPRKDPAAATLAAAPPPPPPPNRSGGTPSKGRGRPRKSDATPVATKAKPGPGRPRASDATPATAAPTAATEPKRGPGRPRMSDASKPTEAAPTTTEPKRGRGRPRKSESSTVPATTESSAPRYVKSPAKLARGRPRKFGSSTAGSTSEALEVNGAGNTTTTTAAAADTDSFKKMVIGHYEIDCTAVELEWPQLADGMEMSITEAEETRGLGYIAGYNLGVIEGTMVLAADKQSLETLHTKLCKGENRPRYDSFHEEEHENDDEEEDHANTKKPKLSSPTTAPKRLYFLWRGRDTSDGEIHCGRNEGYLDFSETSGGIVSFKGVRGIPSIGNECEFTGNKIHDMIIRQPIPWSELSQRAADEANAARWS